MSRCRSCDIKRQAEYRKTDQGKKVRRSYKSLDRVKAKAKEYISRPDVQERRREYTKTPDGRVRDEARRRRYREKIKADPARHAEAKQKALSQYYQKLTQPSYRAELNEKARIRRAAMSGDPDWVARYRAYARERHARLIETDPGYRVARREYLRRYNRERKRIDPHYLASISARRHARRALVSASGTFTKDDVLRIHKAQRFRCAICRTSIRNRYHIDHIVPIARGGANKATNLQLLCPLCNLQKGKKDPIDFMRRKGFLV